MHHHALRGPALTRVLPDGGALSVPVLGHGDQVLARAGVHQCQHLVLLGQAHADHARRGPAHGTHRGLCEASREPAARHHHEVVLAVREHHADQLVAGVEVDGGESGAR